MILDRHPIIVPVLKLLKGDIGSPIPFRRLRSIADDHLVWLGLSLPARAVELVDTMKDMTEWFQYNNLIDSESQIVNLQYITGNVLEETGDYRKDVLITFSEGVKIDFYRRYIMRISHCADICWPSDFVDNYSKDYKP